MNNPLHHLARFLIWLTRCVFLTGIFAAFWVFAVVILICVTTWDAWEEAGKKRKLGADYEGPADGWEEIP